MFIFMPIRIINEIKIWLRPTLLSLQFGLKWTVEVKEDNARSSSLIYGTLEKNISHPLHKFRLIRKLKFPPPPMLYEKKMCIFKCVLLGRRLLQHSPIRNHSTALARSKTFSTVPCDLLKRIPPPPPQKIPNYFILYFIQKYYLLILYEKL